MTSKKLIIPNMLAVVKSVYFKLFHYFEVATSYYKLKMEKVKLEMELLMKKQKEGGYNNNNNNNNNNNKKRSYSRRVLDIEHGSFTPLVFTSTGGMGPECLRFHCRLAELIANKKGEHYSRTILWIRARTSFALLRSALICLRGSRTIRRRKMGLTNADIDIQNSEAAIS